VLQPVWNAGFFEASASPVVANGILYLISQCAGESSCLEALDPHDGTLLWQSEPFFTWHWETPIVVDGSIFVSSSVGMRRFGLGASPPSHTVTPSVSDGGSVAPATAQFIFDGDTATFAIRPDAHRAIDEVTGCGGTLDGQTYTTGAITADCTVAATFVPVTHVVTPSAGPDGNIEPATPQTIDDGDTASFTLTPVPPYVIGNVTGCRGTLDGDIYTTGPVLGDCAVVATFALDASDVIFRNGFEDSAP
jgi:outer membrane protein assembly factor BamB